MINVENNQESDRFINILNVLASGQFLDEPQMFMIQVPILNQVVGDCDDIGEVDDDGQI